MSIVREASGAQVLPDVKDDRQTVTGWAASCAANADRRTISRAYRELAGRLHIYKEEVDVA